VKTRSIWLNRYASSVSWLEPRKMGGIKVNYYCPWEKFEDNKGKISNRSLKTTTLIGQKKVTTRQTMVDKILHRKLKSEQHELPLAAIFVGGMERNEETL
jgi:hypothetical protein